MNPQKIGEVAGEIWQHLNHDKELTLSRLQQEIGPKELVTAAVGWLARENKLEFKTDKNKVKIRLKF